MKRSTYNIEYLSRGGFGYEIKLNRVREKERMKESERVNDRLYFNV